MKKMWMVMAFGLLSLPVFGAQVMCRQGGPVTESEYVYMFESCRAQICPSLCTAGGTVNGQYMTDGNYYVVCNCN